MVCLVGDCLVAAAFLSYAGPFLSNYREVLVNKTWLSSVSTPLQLLVAFIKYYVHSVVLCVREKIRQNWLAFHKSIEFDIKRLCWQM